MDIYNQRSKTNPPCAETYAAPLPREQEAIAACPQSGNPASNHGWTLIGHGRLAEAVAQLQ